jgi:hypothetical protein
LRRRGERSVGSREAFWPTDSSRRGTARWPSWARNSTLKPCDVAARPIPIRVPPELLLSDRWLDNLPLGQQVDRLLPAAGRSSGLGRGQLITFSLADLVELALTCTPSGTHPARSTCHRPLHRRAPVARVGTGRACRHEGQSRPVIRYSLHAVRRLDSVFRLNCRVPENEGLVASHISVTVRFDPVACRRLRALTVLPVLAWCVPFAVDSGRLRAPARTQPRARPGLGCPLQRCRTCCRHEVEGPACTRKEQRRSFVVIHVSCTE